MAETKVLTESILTPILANVQTLRGVASCLEDCVTPGIYEVNAASITTEAEPNFQDWQYGTLEVLTRNADIIQRYTQIDGTLMMFRVRRLGTWSKWKSLSLTTIS